MRNGLWQFQKLFELRFAMRWITYNDILLERTPLKTKRMADDYRLNMSSN